MTAIIGYATGQHGVMASDCGIWVGSDKDEFSHLVEPGSKVVRMGGVLLGIAGDYAGLLALKAAILGGEVGITDAENVRLIARAVRSGPWGSDVDAGDMELLVVTRDRVGYIEPRVGAVGWCAGSGPHGCGTAAMALGACRAMDWEHDANAALRALEIQKEYGDWCRGPLSLKVV